MKKIFLSALITVIISSVSFGQSIPKTPEPKKETFTAARSIKHWTVPGESNVNDY